MRWTDEELTAYADGELTGERRLALDEALRHDAQLQGRVRTLQAQRQRISAAFASVLAEPVPERLTALLAAPATEATPPPVVDLAAERERRTVRRSAPSWAQWGGMAASVALGVAIGMQISGLGTPVANDALVSEAGGKLVAGGPLAQALNAQLASDAAAAGSAAPVMVPVSFIDKDGQYCRAFSTERMAGLACREAAQWTIQTASGAERAASGEMRQASSPLPRAVLEAVDARAAGNALSSAQERQARDRGWVR